MNPRGFDHLVVPCGDLDDAARAWEALGFRVGPRNRHPWGTENRILQFPGGFVELIALAADYRTLAADHEAFPFAGFLAGHGASRAPSGLVVLRAADADADARHFAEQGIGSGRRLDFSRSGVGPGGQSRTVAFSLAFAEAGTMPDVGFFTCRHHHPAHFWDPAAQRHPNGASGVAAIELTAARPWDHAPFLARFAGAPAELAPGGGLSVALPDDTAIRLVPGADPPRLAGLAVRAPGPTRAAAIGALTVRFEPPGR